MAIGFQQDPFVFFEFLPTWIVPWHASQGALDSDERTERIAVFIKVVGENEPGSVIVGSLANRCQECGFVLHGGSVPHNTECRVGILKALAIKQDQSCVLGPIAGERK